MKSSEISPETATTLANLAIDLDPDPSREAIPESVTDDALVDFELADSLRDNLYSAFPEGSTISQTVQGWIHELEHRVGPDFLDPNDEYRRQIGRVLVGDQRFLMN